MRRRDAAEPQDERPRCEACGGRLSERGYRRNLDRGHSRYVSQGPDGQVSARAVRWLCGGCEERSNRRFHLLSQERGRRPDTEHDSGAGVEPPLTPKPPAFESDPGVSEDEPAYVPTNGNGHSHGHHRRVRRRRHRHTERPVFTTGTESDDIRDVLPPRQTLSAAIVATLILSALFIWWAAQPRVPPGGDFGPPAGGSSIRLQPGQLSEDNPIRTWAERSVMEKREAPGNAPAGGAGDAGNAPAAPQ